ncbi:MAG: pilin [Candidatus Peregrinibacteria bacterium]
MRFKTLLILGLLWMAEAASAAPLGSREVNLSTPVGGDVLPGGNFSATDIKTSFVFAKLIPFVIRYALGLGAALAVAVLIIGGYQFITSYGNQEKRQAAQKTVQYALIGLVITIVAFGIVTVITNFSFTPPPQP